jgi:hypothetical protein
MIRMAEEDPQQRWCGWPKKKSQSALELAHIFAGVKSAHLMQNHGFLAASTALSHWLSLPHSVPDVNQLPG